MASDPWVRGAARLRLFVFSVVVWAVSPVAAQDQEAINRAAARDLALQAADAYDSGDFAVALDRFTRAQQLFPAPTLSIMQARCLVGLGRWVEGFEKFNETARTPLPSDAPEPFARAVAEAGAAAQELEAKLPRLEVRVAHTAPIDVRYDGNLLPAALYGVTHAIDPGSHRVEAYSGEARYFSQDFSIAERERQVVQVPVPPEPTQIRPVTAKPVLAHDTTSPPERRTPEWVVPTAFGVAGVGVAGAVVSLVLGSNVKSDLDEVCSPGCPASAEEQLEDYRLYRTLFFTSAALGAVGAGVGLYFVLGDEPNSASVSINATATGARVSGRF